MKVGIIGAGLNSNYHVSFAKAYTGAEIVGIADRDVSRARDIAAKHGIPGVFGSAVELLDAVAPDVVHVVTPPGTHYAVVSEVLAADRHVLVEKPLALSLNEAEALYRLAERRGVRLCPVHNHLFDPCMAKAAMLIRSGAAGRVVNVESYYGLNTEIPALRDYPQPNVLPWLYGLPGGVYHDFLPHPLYVLLEYIGAPRTLEVMQRSNGVLAQRLPDEIRILLDGENALGSVTVSFAAKPHLHFLRIYGTRMMVEVDFNTMTTVAHRVSVLPKAAQKATYNLDEGWQRARATVSNVGAFLTGRLKPYQGMMTLIHEYYDSIRSGKPPPISKERALLVVKTMDAVFKQLKYAPLKHERIPARSPGKPGAKKVLVTGGTGFVGRGLVKRLVDKGYHVRVLARKLSKVDAVAAAGAEVFWGDVADLDSFGQAFAGRDLIIHLAAGTSGTARDSETATLQGTRNLLELCRRHKPRKLVYVSSCSVYGVTDFKKDAVVSETAHLERFPERRGSYSASKQQAEQYVSEYMKSDNVPVVILRPGTVYGPGGDLYTPMMGFRVGHFYLVIANGSFTLPFVYVDNLIDALVRVAEAKEADGEVFNVVDTAGLTKRKYMETVLRRIHPRARVLYVPYALLFGITWLQKIGLWFVGRPPYLSRYRLTSSQRNVLYDSRKITARLGWKSPISPDEAINRLVQFELSKQHAESGLASPAKAPTAAEARAVCDVISG